MSTYLKLKNKNVLFVTTKNLDYIRNAQEISSIRRKANSYAVIGSNSKYYFIRLLVVYVSLFRISASKFDTVFIGFAPQLVLPIFGHKFRDTYVVADFFISLFNTLCEERKLFRKDGLFGHLLHYLDQITLQKADYLICDTISHGEYFADEFQVSCSKLHALYLKTDKTIYYPRVTEKPSVLKDKYLVLYFGSILPLQGIETILQAITLLQAETEIFFYVIGPVREETRAVYCPDETNVEFIDWLSQEELAEYIAQADLCLAGHFSRDIAKAKRTIPGKAYIYEAMEKPMVLGDNSANRELFQPDDRHIYVEMGNAQTLADRIYDQYRKKHF